MPRKATPKELEVFHDPAFIAATRKGIEDWRAGRVQPLSEVLKKLGIKVEKRGL